MSRTVGRRWRPLFGVVLTMARVRPLFPSPPTEHMYQQLRKKCPQFAGPNFASVHYLMVPTAREELHPRGRREGRGWDAGHLDLGRVLRDRKTMPIKYPLPEVVIIHKDNSAWRTSRA